MRAKRRISLFTFTLIVWGLVLTAVVYSFAIFSRRITRLERELGREQMLSHLYRRMAEVYVQPYVIEADTLIELSIDYTIDGMNHKTVIGEFGPYTAESQCRIIFRHGASGDWECGAIIDDGTRFSTVPFRKLSFPDLSDDESRSLVGFSYLPAFKLTQTGQTEIESVFSGDRALRAIRTVRVQERKAPRTMAVP